jgi:hypothetical protein
MNSFRAGQCKPVVVQNPTFGKGLIVERRPDGMNVVQLPWGKACVHNQSLGTVMSSQFKRSRNDEDETDDDMDTMNDEQSHSTVNQDHRIVRRKIDVHQYSPSSTSPTPPMMFQFQQQPERMQS